MSVKRLHFLESRIHLGEKEVLYGLAMEYRSMGRSEEALSTFSQLKTKHPNYVPQYLMCAQLLQAMDRQDEAKKWIEEGIAIASRVGERHALAELQDALMGLEVT